MTLLLQELQWLQWPQWIEYKLVVLIYHWLHSLTLSHLATDILRVACGLTTTLVVGNDIGTHHSYDVSCCWQPRLLCGGHDDLEQPGVWYHVGIIFVHVQVLAQDTTFYKKLSRQLPLHMTNCFRPVPQIPSFRLMLLGVLVVTLTIRHLNQFFDE